MSENRSARADGRTHRHRHSKSNRVLRTITFVLTPFLMLTIVCCLSIILLNKPYSRIKPYTGLIFPKATEQPQNIRTLNKYRDDDAPLMKKEIDDEKLGKHTMIYPYYGDFYATLNCENAGLLNVPVYAGTTDDVLQLGAGWYNGSVFIGNVGNVVIAGHNYTVFYHLFDCEIGDIVTLETDYCKLTYEITERVIFDENDDSYVRPTEDDRLTLYTCYNENRLGLSPYRLCFICKLTDREWKEVSAE